MSVARRRERYPVNESATTHGGDDGQKPHIDGASSRSHTAVTVALVIAATAAAGVGGYFVGKSGGADAQLAQEQGRALGAEEGRAKGLKAGYAAGLRQAKARAHDKAYIANFKDAYRGEFVDAGLDRPGNVKVRRP